MSIDWTRALLWLIASLWVVVGGSVQSAEPGDQDKIRRTYLSAPEDPKDTRQDKLAGLVFGVNGYTAITGSDKYGGHVAVRIWDLRQAHGKPIELAEHAGPLDAIDLGNDGKLLATGDYNGKIRLWNISAHPRKMAGFQWYKYQVEALALSPKGDLLAASGNGGMIGLKDLDRPSQPPVALRGHANEVSSLDFSVDGKLLASSSADGTIRIWKTDQTQAPPVVLRGHQPDLHPRNKNYDQNYSRKVIFSRNGKLLVAGSGDGSVQIWDATQLSKPPRVIQAHKGAVDSISIDQGSAILATAGRDHRILLWNLSDLDAPPRLLIDLGKDWVSELVFEPTGTYLGAVINGAVELIRLKAITPQSILIE